MRQSRLGHAVTCSLSDAQIEFTLSVIQTMVDMYANETVVMGLQPVNEPWQFTPIDWLKVTMQGVSIELSQADLVEVPLS